MAKQTNTKAKKPDYKEENATEDIVVRVYPGKGERLSASITVETNELFMFSEVEENQMQFIDLLNGLSELLHDVTNNNNQFIEKVPLDRKERDT